MCTDDVSNLRERQLLSVDTGTKAFNNAVKKYRAGWAHTLSWSSKIRHLAQVLDFEFLAITLTGIKWAMCRYGEVFFALNMIPLNTAAIFRVQDLKRNPQTPSPRLPSPRNAEAVCLWLSQSRAVLALGRAGGLHAIWNCCGCGDIWRLNSTRLPTFVRAMPRRSNAFGGS